MKHGHGQQASISTPHCGADDVNGFYNDAQSSHKYATIDGTSYSSTAVGCQSGSYNLPSGWELAPSDADGIRMSTIGGWGTRHLDYSDGKAYRTTYYGTSAGTQWGSGHLTNSTLNGAPAYGVDICDMRVLIRVSTLNC